MDIRRPRSPKPKRMKLLFWRRDRQPSPDRFEKFTEGARKVFLLAQEEAQGFNHNYIGTEHFLLGLVREEEGIAARVLVRLGVQLPKVRSAVEFIIGRGDGLVVGNPGLTPRAKKVIELAMDEARRLNSAQVGTEHLLLGLVHEGEGIAAGVLESFGVSLEQVRQQVMLAIANPETPLPPPSPAAPPLRPQGMRTPRSFGGGFGQMGANQLVYGLALPPEMFTRLSEVARQRNRPVDDLIREAIASVWLSGPKQGPPTPETVTAPDETATTTEHTPPSTGQ